MHGITYTALKKLLKIFITCEKLVAPPFPPSIGEESGFRHSLGVMTHFLLGIGYFEEYMPQTAIGVHGLGRD